MAIPYAYGPVSFKDPSSPYCDVQHAKIALTIVAQCMRFLGDDEAIVFELIVHLVEHTTVCQRIPRSSVRWRGHFIQLRPAHELCSAVKQHSFRWLLGNHRPLL